MNPIEDYALTTEELALFLNITPETFRTWQKRHGFLKRCSGGRGVPARFMFRETLSAIVASKLMSVGISREQACNYADSGSFVFFFVTGDAVSVPFVDGKIDYAANPMEDVFLTFHLENDGWKLAEFIAGLIELKMGKSVAEIVLQDFHAIVDEQRGQS